MIGQRQRPKLTRIIGLLLCFCSSSFSFAKTHQYVSTSKLPLGERKYILDENNPYAPVAIQPKDRVVKETYLKDPIQRGAHPQPRVAPKVAVKRQPKKVRSPWEPTQLRFKKVAVRGHLARPRVEFERDIIAIDRVDEPTRQDFFQRVFEPARDEQF